MGKIVCLDTNVLIWGIKQQAEPGQEEMIERTIDFLEWLELEGFEVIIPAVCLAELLMKIPQEEQPTIITDLQKRFMIVPSDIAAAACFGSIWQAYLSERARQKDETREKIKMDDLVISTAIAQKANILYSEDPHIKSMSNHTSNRIEVQPIPIVTKQLTLTGIAKQPKPHKK